MQKQHLHLFLLIFSCYLWGGCGEPALRQLNPYLHGKQELTIVLPDSGIGVSLIRGWDFLPLSDVGENEGRLRILTPDRKLIHLDWYTGNSDRPILFSSPVRLVNGLSMANMGLGVSIVVLAAEDGRSIECRFTGDASLNVKARVGIDVTGVKQRGLAALEETWTATKTGMDIALPWGDHWKLQATDDFTPLPRSSSEIAAEVDFGSTRHRSFTLHWSPLPSRRGERGLDIDTELISSDQALAFLIASIPPVHEVIPEPASELEHAAELTRAQWLVHAEFSPQYLARMSEPNEQVHLLTYGLAAYQAMYDWGTVDGNELLAKEPLLDAAMSRIDTTSREIERGATIEDRLREATLWTFAEENLATDRANIRKVYREQAVTALDDAQDELKRRVRLWRRENSAQRKDTLALYETFVGGDSTAKSKVKEIFVAPDTVAILRIAGRGSLGWLTEVSPDWHAVANLPWPLEMDRLRYRFSENVKNRLTDHWDITQRTMLDVFHPGVFPQLLFGDEPVNSAAAEVETVVEDYLGIRPQWRKRSITFDPRLPQGWGRTRARVPFAEGELYVDYDFTNNRVWLAATGLKEVFTCQIYVPTPSGAISGQFKFEPGDSPKLITLVVEDDNKYRLRFESDGLPE